MHEYDDDLFLSTTFCDYVRLQTLIWQHDGLAEPSILGSKALVFLQSRLSTLSDRPLLIDCRDVLKTVTSSAITGINTPLVFVYCDESLIDGLTLILGANLQRGSAKHGAYACWGKVDASKIDQYIRDAESLVLATIKSYITDCYMPNDGLQALSSTPIQGTGIWNARRIIANPERFLQTSVALLDVIKKSLKVDISSAGIGSSDAAAHNTRFLAVSLRSSPFASAVWSLLGSVPGGIEIVDHLGPQFGLIEVESITDPPDEGYVFVGDFILGGTEFKTAQLYAQLRGSFVRAGVCLASLLEPEAYSRRIPLHSLFTMPDCCPDVQYYIMRPTSYSAQVSPPSIRPRAKNSPR